MSANNLLLTFVTHPTNLLSNTVLKDLIGCWHADECACPAGLNVLIDGVAQCEHKVIVWVQACAAWFINRSIFSRIQQAGNFAIKQNKNLLVLSKNECYKWI